MLANETMQGFACILLASRVVRPKELDMARDFWDSETIVNDCFKLVFIALSFLFFDVSHGAE